MKNKETAYEYIRNWLFLDASIDRMVDRDDTLSSEDKEELINTFNVLKTMNQNSLAFQEVQKENVRKTMDLMQDNIGNTFTTIMSLKSSLQDVIRDAKRAYTFVMWMYVVAFYLGVALIITAIIFAALDKTILAIAFGTVGLADIVSHFIFKPPLELQTSRSNLAQLMVVLTNWFSDLMNLNSYLSLKGSNITFEELERISSKQNSNTQQMLEMIEKYCEPEIKP
jgi:hypothetical protein